MSLKALLYAALIILFFYGLFTVGFPFLLALIIAFLVEPLITLMTKSNKIKRIYAALAVCTGITFLLFGLFYLLATKVYKELVALFGKLLEMTKDTYANMDWWNNQYLDFLQNIPPQYNDALQQVVKTALEATQNILGQSASFFFNLAAAIPTFFFQALFFLVAFYLISISLPDIRKNVMQYFDPSVHSKVKIILLKLHKTIFGFLRAQFIISCMIFVVVLTGFVIMGINYPSALALLVTIVDVLPILGTGSVLIPMAFYNLFIGKNFLFWGLLLHYAILVVFRRIIEPNVLGESIGLSSLSTLVSMYIGFVLVGFIGLFLGPFLVIFYQALVKVGVIDIKIKF